MSTEIIDSIINHYKGSTLPSIPTKLISPDEYIKGVFILLGIDSDDDLQYIKEGDARKVMCDDNLCVHNRMLHFICDIDTGVKDYAPVNRMSIVQFRKFWALLTSKQITNVQYFDPITQEHINVANAYLPRWDKYNTKKTKVSNESDSVLLTELVKHSNVADTSKAKLSYGYDITKVIEELNKRSKGKKFIAKDIKGNINISLSLKMLSKIRLGENIPSTFKDKDGKAYIFVTPENIEDRVHDICPIHGNKLTDGYCEICEHNYDGMDLMLKQKINFVHSYRNKIDLPKKVKDIVKLLLDSELLDIVGIEGEAAFNRLRDNGKLPSLKITMDDTKYIDVLPSNKSGHKTY